VNDETIEDPSPAPHVKSLNSPTLERVRDPIPCHMNIENVLSWPLFEDQNPNLDLKALLNEQAHDIPTSSSIGDFDQTSSEEHLVRRFMDRVFIFNPVLDEAKVQKYARDTRYNGIGWDAQSCLLLLIYAHGALESSADTAPSSVDASDSRQQSSFKQAESYFSAAQRRLGLLLCRSGVLEAQCFFLAGVYLMACIKPLEAWKMFVQALACCQSFYSGRSPPNANNEAERRLKESIYWTCFKSELELRLELNVSESSVWDSTYPSFFPSPPEELKLQREIVWYFYLAEIALGRLGNRILNFIYTARPATSGSSTSSTSDMVESVLSFEQQASDWKRSLPRGLGLDETSPADVVSDNSDLHTTLKFILLGHLLDCYEMMYWPFIANVLSKNNTNATFQSPQTIQTDKINNGFIRKGLTVCVERIAKNEPGFFYRHHGTWLMLRSCTRSGLVLIAASRDEKVAALLPDGWRASVGKIIDMLRFWRRESRDVEDRLRLVETMWRTG
jgi:Fungal specific transcription factor domain